MINLQESMGPEARIELTTQDQRWNGLLPIAAQGI